MYDIIKNVISFGRYELADMLKKIDTIWLQGNLTDEQHTDLIQLARDYATPEMGYASLQEQILALSERVTAVEEALHGLPTEDEYPAWHQPGSAVDAYYTGSKMTYTDGMRYECIVPEGYAVTYGPDVLPGMWKLVPEERNEVKSDD